MQVSYCMSVIPLSVKRSVLFLMIGWQCISGQLVYAQTVQADAGVLQVITKKRVAAVNAAMWGIFFEDINFGADGGLYAELVKNRSFEFDAPKMGWKEDGQGTVLINNRVLQNPGNAHYAAITVNGNFRFTNEGFRGMGIKKGEQYNFSVWAQATAKAGVSVTIKILNANGETIGATSLPSIGNEWKKIQASFIATQTEAKATLQLVFTGNGIVNMDMISLFPKETWKQRPGGLRKDLVEKLDSLKPGFLRFPGGCIVEGRNLENRYQWKKTVGSMEEREQIISRWSMEFSHRAAPDYYQSFGLGFFEYFQLAEDLGAQPLPILNCGMACQYNSGEVTDIHQIDPYIQDAIDLMEFANGDTSTYWGKLRSSMGHPKPFGLSMIGIGNEQWDAQYLERYQAFEKVLKTRYPSLRLIAAAGPSPAGKSFDFAWQEFPKTKVDLLDEHYYQSPSWFLNNAERYDWYDRKGPKVFAGEYASHDTEGKEPESRNTWLSAITEAAFMTGLERNADVVQMAAYAPLLAHTEAWQWRPDLIWFDNLRSVATPNYYVQKLFANYKGTAVVPVLHNGKVLAGADSMYASATLDETNHSLIIKIVNVSAKQMKYTVMTDDKGISGTGIMQILASTDRSAINTLDHPSTIVPLQQTIKASAGKMDINLVPLSFTVVIIPAGKPVKNK